MERKHSFEVFFLLAGMLLLTNCQKEYFELNRLSDEMEVRPDLIAPLFYGSVTMEDIVTYVDSGGYTHEFDDGLIYLAYSDTVVNVMADTMVEVPNGFNFETYFDYEVNVPEFVGGEVGEVVHFLKSKIVAIELDGDDRVDSMRIKGGEIVVKIESSFKHLGTMNISSKQIIDPRGDPFFVTIEINDLSGSFEDSVRINSDHYYVETNVLGDSNVIQFDLDLALINSGNPVSPGEQCRTDINFLDMGFYSIFGYIDSRNAVSESGTLDIPFYSDHPELASVKLADPRINVHATNSMGVPFEIELNNVIASATDGTTELLEFYEGYPFVVPAPGLSIIGESLNVTFEINRETSNFDQLLAIAPTSLSYEVEGRTHPGSATESHFLLDTSRLTVETEFLLPLDFRSTLFTLEDTLEFEMNREAIDTSLVKLARVSVATRNELPLKLDLQVYLLDEFHLVIDSVFGEEHVLLAASEVDADGRLVQASEETNTTLWPAEKLNKINKVRYLQVMARMNTSEMGTKNVKLYSDYSLEFEISLFANLRINSREQ